MSGILLHSLVSVSYRSSSAIVFGAPYFSVTEYPHVAVSSQLRFVIFLHLHPSQSSPSGVHSNPASTPTIHPFSISHSVSTLQSVSLP